IHLMNTKESILKTYTKLKVNILLKTLNSTSFKGDISKWNVSNVVDMNSMFHSAINFNSNISGWNTTRVENMSYIFYDASNSTYISIT
ncbi:BspA family leucine-rich repeat surface protein, partial [Mycoplasmopsis bovis]|uniref:BspA family leucine-rich repeat surface protein n=1 Tax=Mycoplasmopsis bovis TaxID=28903 RepID=UPI003D2D0D83